MLQQIMSTKKRGDAFCSYQCGGNYVHAKILYYILTYVLLLTVEFAADLGSGMCEGNPPLPCS